MGDLPAGRAMWEGGQAIDTYGTSLALMLLPYWTDGRIASMEGLYYESAATTPFHFMAVAPLSGPGNASNPVRGLDYRAHRGLRPRGPLPAAAGGPLLHGVLDRSEGEGRREPRARDWSRRSAITTAPHRQAGRSTRSRGARPSRRSNSSRSWSPRTPARQAECFGRAPAWASARIRARPVGVPRGGLVERPGSAGPAAGGGRPGELEAGRRHRRPSRPRSGGSRR